MKKSQHQHLKKVLESLDFKYYNIMEIWIYCNHLSMKKSIRFIESPEMIISYVIRKNESVKGKDCWDYKMIDGMFCISYKKPINVFEKTIAKEKSKLISMLDL